MAELSRHKVGEVEIRFVVLSLDNYKHYQAAHPLSAPCAIEQLPDDTSNYIN
jgi:hypothetical protein